jgi:hypothetical protein
VTHKKPTHSKPLAWLCYVGATVWFIGGIVFLLWRWTQIQNELQRQTGLSSEELAAEPEYAKYKNDALGGITVLGLFVVLPISGGLFTLGRRLSVKTAESVLEEDPRPPIVYFRSFRDDDRPSSSGQFFQYLLGQTEEQDIVSELAKHGPVIAIGNPTEKLPLLGAARIYSTSEEWQGVAVKLIERSQLVVYRGGFTPGFLWEIGRARDLIPPEKVLLLIPFANSRREYTRFRDLIEPAMRVRFPEETGSLLMFTSQWNPVCADKPSSPLTKQLKTFFKTYKRSTYA